METVGEIYKHQRTVQQKASNNRPVFNAELVYHSLIDEICTIISDRNRMLVLNNENKYIIGQVALWYANDARFKGDLLKGLSIRGNVGTGKTVLVKALIHIMMVYERVNAKFIYSTDLTELYIQQRGVEIDMLKQRKYLIIDDLGVENVETKVWGNSKEPFNDVFEYRHRNNLTTIITTNLTPQKIGDDYGIRIRDRFRESFNDLVLDGESLRK